MTSTWFPDYNICPLLISSSQQQGMRSNEYEYLQEFAAEQPPLPLQLRHYSTYRCNPPEASLHQTKLTQVSELGTAWSVLKMPLIIISCKLDPLHVVFCWQHAITNPFMCHQPVASRSWFVCLSSCVQIGSVVDRN